MKRLRPRHKLVLHPPLLLVGEERTVLLHQLLPQRLGASLHQIGGGRGIEVGDRHLEQFAEVKTPLDNRRLGVRQKATFGRNFHDANCGLISRQKDGGVQGMFGSPDNQFFRGITPTQAEWRLQHGLAEQAPAQQHQQATHFHPVAAAILHGGSFASRATLRKPRSHRSGFALIEATLALTLLTVVGIILLKLSINILAPRQWVLQQSVSDAYMTFERAFAERQPYSIIAGAASPWPLSPATTITPNVVLGSLPGGVAINGTVTRTRFANPAFPEANEALNPGTYVADVAANPSGMRVVQLQAIVTYTVGRNTYVKSRTVSRSQ
jgi:hypothetical protein